MRIVYAGTPQFAVPALRRLIDGPHTIAAVYTQPDRPAGRGRRLTASPVKALASEHDLPVQQPDRLSGAAEQAVLRDLDADVMIVAAYGLILPPAVLAIPRHGCLNIHASLLPRWRGAAPIQRAIEAGDRQTGVCLMEMAAGLDTGPVVARRSTPISDEDTAASVHDRLAEAGAALLVETLDDWAAGRCPAVAQPATGITYAEKITTDEARVDWQQPAEVLARRIHAFNPWPVMRCGWAGATLKLWLAEPLNAADADAPPGTVLSADAQGIDVQTGSGVLRLKRVQAAGGRAQDVDAFLRGHGLQAGERFD